MNWELKDWLVLVLVGAGIGQLILCLASPAIPVVLGWKKSVEVLPKLLRQVFWTYACYVLGAHLAFGLLSVFGARLLVAGDGMAAVVSGFIACWWGVRLILHWTTFDTADVPEGRWTRLAEFGLGFLFLVLTAVYLSVFIFNLRGGG
jgi:hypothetical protein